VVAEFVAAVDEVEQPRAIVLELAVAAKQEVFESSVFMGFANAAHLSVESLENSKPPRPDIRCRTPTQRVLV
jgi:hypothetical protein